MCVCVCVCPQVQEAVGTDVSSMQEVMERMAEAVRTDSIETLTMTVGTQVRVYVCVCV